MKRSTLFPLRVAALGVTALLTGCETCKEYTLTGKLWGSHSFAHFREPAAEPHPAVFYSPVFDDFLVAYDSLLDGDAEPRRQNYFVMANEAKLANHKQPDLISTNGLTLISVPLNGATNVLPYATYDLLLTIHTTTERLGPYPLPNYKETDGTAIKAALTPLSVTGDATVGGLFLAAIGFIGLCQSGVSFAVH